MYDLIDQSVDRLSQGSRFILWAMRNWVDAVSQRVCPPRVLAQSFAGMGALPALNGLHVAMALLQSESTVKLALQPNATRRIGEHEAILLMLWADSLDPARHARRQATLALLAPARAVAIGRALDSASAALIDADIPPTGLETAIVGETGE